MCGVTLLFLSTNLPIFLHFLDNICMVARNEPANPHCQWEDISQCPLCIANLKMQEYDEMLFFRSQFKMYTFLKWALFAKNKCNFL